MRGPQATQLRDLPLDGEIQLLGDSLLSEDFPATWLLVFLTYREKTPWLGALESLARLTVTFSVVTK